MVKEIFEKNPLKPALNMKELQKLEFEDKELLVWIVDNVNDYFNFAERRGIDALNTSLLFMALNDVSVVDMREILRPYLDISSSVIGKLMETESFQEHFSREVTRKKASILRREAEILEKAAGFQERGVD